MKQKSCNCKPADNNNVNNVKDELKYPGVAIDTADNNHVDWKLVNDQTRMQNNNPQTDD